MADNAGEYKAKGKAQKTAAEEIDELIENSDQVNPERLASAVVARAMAAKMSPVKLNGVINRLSDTTGISKSVLNATAKSAGRGLDDWGLGIAHKTLEQHYSDGDHLVRAMDGSFWAYTGTHWRRIRDDNVRRNILKVVEIVVPPLNYSSVVESALRLLAALKSEETDVLRLLDEPPPIINCRNGELAVNEDGTVELRPHRHDSYLTYCLDVDYDPKAECPIFDEAVRGIFDGDDDMVRHFLEFMGYAIQPRRDIAAWFMLYGAGSNGKTKLMETVRNLMSRDAVADTRMGDIENNRFAVGGLVGRLMLLDDDVDARTKIPDGFLKKVSERKAMTGEHKFKDQFDFIACCLPVLLANNWPRCDDLSLGTRRRAQIIPFRRVFRAGVDDDPKLFPRIWKNELPGVLNRAVAGLRRLRERGRFKEPTACTEAREEWLRMANPLKAFVDESCDQGPDLKCTTRDFFREYRAWAADANVRYTETRNTILKHLEDLGYKTSREGFGQNQSGVHGIKPKRHPF